MSMAPRAFEIHTLRYIGTSFSAQRSSTRRMHSILLIVFSAAQLYMGHVNKFCEHHYAPINMLRDFV